MVGRCWAHHLGPPLHAHESIVVSCCRVPCGLAATMAPLWLRITQHVVAIVRVALDGSESLAGAPLHTCQHVDAVFEDEAACREGRDLLRGLSHAWDQQQWYTVTLSTASANSQIARRN